MDKKRVVLSVALIFISFFTFSQSLALINTPFDEQNPVLSPDFDELYFTRANHPDNVGGQADPGDIWVSEKLSNGSWGPAKNAGDLLNSKGWNGVLGFNENGTIMYLHHHYVDEGTPKTQGIAFSKKVGDSWTKPVNLSIPYFRNVADNQSGWISGDENVILFSIETYNTRGAEDLYVVLRNADGTWRDPRSLGGVVNTAFQEFAPYYTPTDSTLYFASNGRGGEGSTDIFFSKKLDNTWINWSEPVALGDSINSNGRDLSFQNYPTQNFAVYASTLNSDGYGDIKIHRYGQQPEAEDDAPTLFVIDSKTGEYLRAEIRVEDELEQEYTLTSNLESGADISSFAPGTYQATISAKGYLSSQESFEIGEGTDNYTLALQPLEKGARVVLENVLFEQSRANILSESYDQLDLVVEMMEDNPDMKIKLEGHTDTRGNPRANLKLSKLRVDAVKEYLVDKGISKRRIDGKGYGGKNPLYPEGDEETRKKNRRVEFVIVK